MKRRMVGLLLLLSVLQIAVLSAEAIVGGTYNIVGSVFLVDAPGGKGGKILNKKATMALGRKEFISVDDTVTVEVTEVEKTWAKVRVVNPVWLKDTHQGWLPLKKIKVGSKVDSVSGWIKEECLAFENKKSDLPLGILQRKAAVAVLDDGSEWLKIIEAPIRTLKKDRFLKTKEFQGKAFIERKVFTTVMPGRW